jgi:hypothetical protein
MDFVRPESEAELFNCFFGVHVSQAGVNIDTFGCVAYLMPANLKLSSY